MSRSFARELYLVHAGEDFFLGGVEICYFDARHLVRVGQARERQAAENQVRRGGEREDRRCLYDESL